VRSVNGLITAIATNSNANILSTPQLMILNNTEGVVEVGQTVPVPVKTIANNISSISVQDKKAALTLKITPQINSTSRFIKLKIKQSVDDFSKEKLTTSDGIGTITRQTETEVVVRDRDTIVTGGLMRDKENYTLSKVPLLGDIPILGWLFKNKQKSQEKVNLLFFLTPKIMKQYAKDSSETLRDVVNRRSAHLKNTYGKEDPFGPTVKGLFEKAEKQEKAPLYDEETNTPVEDTIRAKAENTTELSDEEAEDALEKKDSVPEKIPSDAIPEAAVPNYQHIVQEVSKQQAGVQK